MKPIAFEKVALLDAKRVHEGKARPRAPDWSVRRNRLGDERFLHPDTAQWIDTLPEGVRPLHLAQRFPRIANLIFGLWLQPVRCESYLADLLIVRRNFREGFPLEVAKDIVELSVHYATLHPPERSWSPVH